MQKTLHGENNVGLKLSQNKAITYYTHTSLLAYSVSTFEVVLRRPGRDVNIWSISSTIGIKTCIVQKVYFKTSSYAPKHQTNGVST